MDDFLKAMGIDMGELKYDDLTSAERDTLTKWLDQVKVNEVTIESTREYIRSMRDAVEGKLADTPETVTIWLFFQVPNREAVLLKARLRNYMLLEAFLSSYEKAKLSLQKALDRVN